ncbi:MULTISPECIES: DUF3152 domain-containing protein [unclassified Streptomyces]|uniref:DUF3152 domain-containing protein n=1 Tax=unclassified Streptomyces TaxID=2593676 RepID=UPI001D1BAF86|nr:MULTISPECIES: DUF3152 domain-containing protein [unclassified Streptomyces]MBD0712036.1 hypothetical protein [Streptomyces sp. CBMA291]MBD0717979.1 hypothetical protein [Streptomyces sp. CBMA370]
MAKRAVPAGRGRTAGGRGGGRRWSPTRRGRLLATTLALTTVVLSVGTAVSHCAGPAEDAKAAHAPPQGPVPPEPATTTTKPAPKPERTANPTAKATTKPPTTPPVVPRSGSGTFTTARASGAPVGHSGSLRRYEVQVEEGVDLDARETAAEIQRILDHPRSWAAHGKGRFQLVSEDADFVVRIATPDTADKLCGEQGLDTQGELNCETTDGVVVNLKRWMLGSPTFAGTAAEYRHLIVNHEVGHEIGIRRHLGCPGPGRPAPAMMQQIKGLDGCRSNAFPYAEDGSYISGPIVS